MEHRWGRRLTLKVPIRIFMESRPPVIGLLENVSISGALMQTARPVPLWTRLEIEVLLPLGHDAERVAAHVTRRTRDGAGIEWCELAPQSVLVLLGVEDTHRTTISHG